MRYKLVIAEKPSVAQSLAKVIGATAVSYTHLDVYKRQVENIFENSDFVYMLNQAGGDRQILAKQLRCV